MSADSDTAPFAGRLALVTGASRGIGRAVALALGAAGAQVVALARTVGALEELDDAIRSRGGPPATLVPLDLRDGDAIDRLGATLFERWQRLDMLVGNAGVLGSVTPVAHLPPKVWAELIEVNLTANYRLIRSCAPLLRLAPAPRAVFITSGAAQSGKPFWGGYAATKAGLEALVTAFAAEAAVSGIRANLFNPGPVRTQMRATAMPGEDPASLPAPEEIAAQILPLLSPQSQRTGEVVRFVRAPGADAIRSGGSATA